VKLSFRKITYDLPPPELALFYRHLHGANGPTDYILGLRNQDVAEFHKARAFVFERVNAWTIDAIEGRSVRPATFVPYCKDKDNFSTHAVMDLDEHDGDGERAERWAMAAFEALKIAVPEMCLILVRTGKGWHVWTIADTRLPCSYWVALLEKIVQDAGMELKPGSCELFPSANFASQKYGRGVRAPGSYNPKYDQVDEVAIHNVEPLIASLLAKETVTTGTTFPKRERSTYQDNNNLKTDKIREENQPTEESGEQSTRGAKTTSAGVEESDRSISPAPDDYDDATKLYRAWKQRWARKFKITERRIRHNQLASLTGEMFPQVGHRMARRIAAQQYAKKNVPTKASLEEHLADFDQLWNGLAAFWYGRLSLEEKARLESLKSTAQKDAFRIIYSYNRLAKRQGSTEFFVARDDLASRLGVTPQYAGLIRFNFQESGIIRLTNRYQPHKTANRYSWGLPTLHAQGSPQSMSPTEPPSSRTEAPELEIWRLLIEDAATYDGICGRFRGQIVTERVNIALKRLEDAMCIHKSVRGTYTAGPRAEDSDFRTILEYLAFKTGRDTRIDPTAETLLTQEVSRWVPEATAHHLRRAFDVAVKCKILTLSGEKAAWFGLGTRFGREEDTKRRKATIDASKQTVPRLVRSTG
jgi:hypothetical protein